MIKTHAMSDKDLVRLYQKGDDRAINELLHRYKSRLFSTIYYLVNNRVLAEDLFQDAFIKIILAIRENKYDEQGMFLAWATRIARNVVMDYFRKNKHMKMVYETEEVPIFNFIPQKENSALDDLIKNDKSERVRKLLNYVSDEQREVIILRHYAGLSFKEISKILNVNLNTCLTRMYLAIGHLSEMIEKEKINFH